MDKPFIAIMCFPHFQPEYIVGFVMTIGDYRDVRAERAVHKIHRPKISAVGITVIINGSLGQGCSPTIKFISYATVCILITF